MAVAIKQEGKPELRCSEVGVGGREVGEAVSRFRLT